MLEAPGCALAPKQRADAMTAHTLQLIARPVGLPKDSDFALIEAAPREPAAGEITVAVSHLSLDPAMRVWMSDAKSYWPPVVLGEVMRAQGIGRVIASAVPSIPVGALVNGMVGAQSHYIGPAAGFSVLDLDLLKASGVPSPTWTLHALGATGMTAWFGLHDIGRIKPGETVLVSAAAGAVGSIAAQLAKQHGCRVIGVAGGAGKCAWLMDELKVDGAVDYRAGSIGAQISALAPKGIDVYFDNVGGEILDAALARLRRHARIVLCGGISQYNNTERAPGPSNYLAMISARATMQGFVVIDYFDRYKEFALAMGALIAQGKIVAREDIVDGLENFPAALRRLYQSQNLGKQLLKL